MNKKLGFTNKKTLAASVAGLTLTVALVGVSFIPRTANGEFDINALNNQVQQQQSTLNNHEKRITNVENATNTPTVPPDASTAPTSSSTPQTTPSSGNTPTAAPAGSGGAVSPKTKVSGNGGYTKCTDGKQYMWQSSTYSDGTTSYTQDPMGGPCGDTSTPTDSNNRTTVTN